MKACAHGSSVVVAYEGPGCPLCGAEGEIEELQNALEEMKDERDKLQGELDDRA